MLSRLSSFVLALAAPAALALPAYNAQLESPADRGLPAAESLARPFARVVTAAHVDARRGVPTFLFAARDARGEQPWVAGSGELRNVRPEQAARRYLFELSELYRLAPDDVASARVREVHDTGSGGIIVRFGQAVGDVELFRDTLNVLLDREHRLVAMSGVLPSRGGSERALSEGFRLGEAAAVSVAWTELTGELLSPADVLPTERRKAGYRYFRAAPHALQPLRHELQRDVRVRQVLFPLAGGLEPAWYLELKAGLRGSTTGEWYAWVISAQDGRVLFRKDLGAHAAATFRAWARPTAPHLPYDGPQGTAATPHPTGLPDGHQSPFVAPELITLEHAGISTNDPWMDATAATTNGNNVHAYADLASPDGLSAGDVQADATAPLAWDRTYDVAASPGASADQRKASIAQLFFDGNVFHDWFYDVGFNEAAGNAQQVNYNRGGVGGDPLLLEAQDSSGTDNANMYTPADGESPVMQMFVWTAVTPIEVKVQSPPGLNAGEAGAAQFGTPTFDLTAELVRFDDGTGTADDACTAATATNAAALAGKIALVRRGSCTFVAKAQSAQAAGAVGVLIYNNQAGDPPPLYGSSTAIKIPAVSLTDAAGAQLVQALQSGAVTVTLRRSVSIDRDGTIDNTIVAHEWGHYISNRLVGNGSGLDNNQGGGLGEGWGDFHALFMVVAEEDAARGLTPTWSGVYGLSSWVASGGANQVYYYGIRRVPYSTRMDVNPLTFKHIQDGVDLPSGVPIAGGTDGSFNSEVHNSGEVWATMLWEAYAALLGDSARLTFQQAQDRMKQYLVAAYKMTPNSPTFLEGRDALLSVALAADLADYTLVAKAFARRGAGNEAVAPDRGSRDNRPVVEDFTVGGNLAFVEATLVDDEQSCDNDGALDNGETGTLTVKVKNTGTAPLTQTTGTVTTTLAGISFPAGAALTFPSSQPQQVVSTTVKVALAGLQGVTAIPLELSFTDAELARPRTLTEAFRARGNLDEVPRASASDDVEPALTAWTPAADVTLGSSSPFRRVHDASGGRWFVPNAAQPESQSLVSPPLSVPAVGPFLFTFRHRFAFEADQRGRYDGAVIELREVGTNTWADIGQYAKPGYNGTLTNGSQTQWGFYPSGNPLRGRKAWSARSSGYPQFTTVTVDLGTRYAGKTVEVRFRMGTDDGVADTGWDLDDFQFANLDNTPFPAVVPQPAQCSDKRPTASTGPTLEVNEGEAVQLTGLASHPDGTALTYTWSQLSGPVGTLAGTDTLTPTFTAPKVVKNELARFSLVATAGTESSPPAVARVLIKDVNRPPVAAVVTPLSTLPGAEVTLDGSGSSDPDGDTLAFKWIQTGGPEVTLSADNADKVTFTAPDVGAGTQLTFALEVQDALFTSERAIAVVTVESPNGGQDAGTGTSPKPQGCGCTTGGVDGGLAGLLGLAAALRRRRQARS
ncbi:MAG: hypothetical protein RL653_3234 [Pseudomonadota bacterium]